MNSIQHDPNAPFSQEAEEATLGSILIDPHQFTAVSQHIERADCFFLLRHQYIWQAMLDVKSDDMPLDFLVVANRLEEVGKLDEIGGRGYLMQLINCVPTSIYAEMYAQLVKRTWMRRMLMTAADKIKSFALDEEASIDNVIAQADSIWLEATSASTKRNGAWFGDIISELYEEVERAIVNGGQLSGISTGYRDLDPLIHGFDKGELIIVAGRPGMGKSALLDCLAINIASQGIPVFYATSERGRKQAVTRMQQIITTIPGWKFKSGKLTQQEVARYTEFIGEYNNLPIYFNDDAMPTPRTIRAQADWMIKRHGCQIILFDGMYRAKTGNDRIDEKDITRYGRIALELKSIARSLDVPLVTTHQLNRNLEQRSDKRPMMSDLRESGRIEEEADKILFLYRDEVYNEATEFPNQADVIVAKHREGATGTIALYFEKSLTKFMDASVHRVDLNDMVYGEQADLSNL